MQDVLTGASKVQLTLYFVISFALITEFENFLCENLLQKELHLSFRCVAFTFSLM